MKKIIVVPTKLGGLFLFILGLLIGLFIMQIYYQSVMVYQGKTARDWANLTNDNQILVNKSQKEVSACNFKLASASAQIKMLLDKPIPAPQVVYRTQTKEVHVGCPRYFTSVNGINCIPAISLCYGP